MRTPTVCLNMIVRDESHVIDRCLASVRPFIDRWIIVDTGSTDDTQARIRSALASIPGTLFERAWRNFAHNRNEALSLAKDVADYLFFIDADETITIPPGYVRPALDRDAYHLECEYDILRYGRCALVRSRLPWRWQGVVHEVLLCDAPFESGRLDWPRVVVSHDGARSRDPLTYAKDATLLEEALRAEPNDTRNVFYLAQSYRDAGQLARAREVYRQRATMGGFIEEIWYSLLQIAVLTERLGSPPAEVASCYLAAYQNRPERAESLVELARYHRLRGEYAIALLYARQAAMTPRPADLLFVHEPTYAWRALDEVAISAWYVGEKAIGRDAAARLLEDRRYPPDQEVRIRRNAEFYGIETPDPPDRI